MLLSSKQFRDVGYASLTWRGGVGIDFETTGLSPYRGDRAVLMGFTDPSGGKLSVYLDDPEIQHSLQEFFTNPHLTYCAHNAKFELSFLREQFGIEPKGLVWDTEVMARIERNNYTSYSLQACAQRMKETKYPPMLAWLAQKGNKGQHAKAPTEVLVPYVEQDAWLSWKIFKQQVEVFTAWDSGPYPIKPVVDLECRTLPPLFEMESRGLLVDLDYVKRAIEHEKKKISQAEARFYEISNTLFVDSRKTLQPLFDSHGICYGQTELGNASFTEENLSDSSDHPLVRALLERRGATKRLSAYWENFLELHVGAVIHPSINQNRAQTGRMSISDPSCQNWPTDEDDDDPEFPVRRAFISRPQCQIVSLDYAQMELRLAADEAGDLPMIERIKSGADLHQEIADLAGVKRSLAKNGRFAKQYGAGHKRVAETLNVGLPLAEKICAAIDAQAKGIAAYSRGLTQHAQRTHTGFNFLGRRYFFDRGFEYKYPNYRIQGGCGEILREAIISVDALLKQKARAETYLLIPIHDELLINVHEQDFHLLPQVKQLMVEAHRSKKHLAMDVSCHFGPNFFDMEKVKL